MEDIGDDEVVDWGVLIHPMSFFHVVVAPHVLMCDRVAVLAEPKGRSKVEGLRLVRHSQRETVAASTQFTQQVRCFAHRTPQDGGRGAQPITESL